MKKLGLLALIALVLGGASCKTATCPAYSKQDAAPQEAPAKRA